jgi:alcohol dehydrogenase class IV
MPTRLRDLAVDRAQFDAVASGATQNMWVKTNPRPLAGPADVLALLEAAY